MTAWHDDERDALAREADRLREENARLTRERDEARAANERLRAHAGRVEQRELAALAELDEARAEVARFRDVVVTQVEKKRGDAEAEVERLRGLMRFDQDYSVNREVIWAIEKERDEARAKLARCVEALAEIIVLEGTPASEVLRIARAALAAAKGE